jgi:hypothetical protein
MTPTPAETSESRPAELFQEEIAHLRSASAWARFIAVAGFIVAGVFGLALGLLVAANDRFGISSTVMLMWVVSIVLVAATAHQLLAYSRDVRSFVAHDGLALPRAFRSLRHVFALMCLYVLLTVASEVLGLLGAW